VESKLHVPQVFWKQAEMSVRLGDVFPDFKASTTVGDISFHEWIGDSWAVLFSHPRDYTPVCTTELGEVSKRQKDFEERGVKLIALSCDDVDSHKAWTGDLVKYSGCDINYPIIADPNREIAVQLGMIDPDEKDSAGMPLTCRAVFIIGADKKLKLSILYPATTGRNFNEILRVIDSLQLTVNKKVATPVDWKMGDEAMVIPTLSTEDARSMFPNFRTEDLPSGKQYMRFTKEYM